MNPRPQPRRAGHVLLGVALCALAGCATDQQARSAPPVDPPVDPPVRETRTGVPLLMDIPVLGWFFSHRRVER